MTEYARPGIKTCPDQVYDCGGYKCHTRLVQHIKTALQP
jgi:hypothetical protein